MTSTTTTADSIADSTTTRSLSLEDLFAEQQTLTAVETFSRSHDAGDRDREPDQARYYKSLIPATPPGPGQQYAFEVDLDACSGCKACVVACHSLNGLAEDEAWREVGLLHGAPSSDPSRELPVLQHVTTACHHCVEPGCLKGCPVNAYEKDPETGIVRHLDDQCFGCQYCTLMCPYEVPKYHAGHGIVRKCDMCSDRLSAGEAPACVQACPHEAITIRTVSVDAVKVTTAKAVTCHVEPRGKFAIPHSPKVDQTTPTTVYRTERLELSRMEPSDLRTPQPAHAHGPLSVMLVLTQLGVGGFVGALLLLIWGEAITSTTLKVASTTSLGLVQLGLILATLHLGRPHLAFRAILGWRHSWLSREMLAFGAFMPLAIVGTSLAWSDVIASATQLTVPELYLSQRFTLALFGLGALTGLVAVFTSAMIYIVARKPLWSAGRTLQRFGLTTAIGGSAILTTATGASPLPTILFGALVACKLAFDLAILSLRESDRSDPLVRSAVLLAGPLSGFVTARAICGAVGLVLAVASLLWWPLSIVAFLAVAAGELIERWWFFTAAVGPKMPGSIGFEREGAHS